MSCTHTEVRSSRPYPFFGPIAGATQNRAAHGGCSYVETCQGCGARREVNANQNYCETGPWGPSEAEWQRVLRRRYETALRARPAPIQLCAQDGRVATASIDEDGYVLLRSEGHDDKDEARMLRALPSTFLAAARTLRAAAEEIGR